MSVATLIAPLLAVRCFIAYKTVWDATAGKFKKLSICPRSQRVIDAHESGYWVTGAEILGTGLPVGIVLTEQLGVFCIDLDTVLRSDGTWHPLAHEMCATFNGAAIELSVSAKGLHIFGCARIGEHRVSRKDLPEMQIYSRNRFIALTGNSLVGRLDLDFTAQLREVIAKYLPEPLASAADDVWTTQSYPGYRGGTDDDARLIESLINARGGARHAFGDGAHFRDLWYCNKPVLINAYPPESEGKEWNYSGADQALANMLAFATGFNCERTMHLMWYSGLRRDKWKDHKAYLRDTILRAVRGKIPAPAADAASAEASGVAPHTGHRQQAPTAAPALAYDASPALTAHSLSVPELPPFDKPRGAYLADFDQEALFRGCTYLRERHGVIIPDSRILSPREFDVMFGGYEFQMDVDGRKPSKSAWECFSQSRLIEFPRAEGLRFDPSRAPLERIERQGQIFINSYKPLNIERVKGDPALFLDHMSRLFPIAEDLQIMLAYMAFIAQCKGKKADWTPLIQGTQGNGKSFLSHALEYCIGECYTYWPKADKLGNDFNAHIYGKLLLCVEDLYISEAKGAVWETLKPMVTMDKLEVTPKGVDSAMKEICFNFMLNSNHKRAIRLTRNERRIAPFYTPQQYEADLFRWGMNEDSGYFVRLYDWARHHQGFAVIFDYLMDYRIPDRLHPGVGARRAPKTSSWEQAVRTGMGQLEQEVMEAIAAGKPGFRGGFVSSTAIDFLLMENGMSRKMTRQAREDLMGNIGYQLHEDLPAGRVMQPLPDGTTPLIYVPRDGHPSQGHGWQRGRVEALYWEAQKVSR